MGNELGIWASVYEYFIDGSVIRALWRRLTENPAQRTSRERPTTPGDSHYVVSAQNIRLKENEKLRVNPKEGGGGYTIVKSLTWTNNDV